MASAIGVIVIIILIVILALLIMGIAGWFMHNDKFFKYSFIGPFIRKLVVKDSTSSTEVSTPAKQPAQQPAQPEIAGASKPTYDFSQPPEWARF